MKGGGEVREGDRRNGGDGPHLPNGGVQKVDAVGGSGLLIERRVLEEYGPPWFLCEYDERGLLSKSEDFWFCERAKERGHDIWADCELVQAHIKEAMV